MKEAFDLMKRKIMQDRRIGRSSLEALLEILKEVEAEYGNGWIPCSERLPNHKHNLLLCLESGYVGEGYYSANVFKDVNSYPYDNVIAWMPLPYPYQPTND